MPNMFGGDQCSPEYAPHMWIGKNFVWQVERDVRIGKWYYHVGRTKSGRIVCERCRFLGEERQRVSRQDIPQRVLAAIKSVSWKKAKQEHDGAVALLRGGK